MSKIVLIFFLLYFGINNNLYAQRKCGIEELKKTLSGKDPAFIDRLEQKKKGFQYLIEQQGQSQAAGRTASIASNPIVIPVIFHIIVNSGQYDMLGGKAGIIRRCDSQIAVLNRDFNAQNPDSNLIPPGWRHLFGASGIHFALAHTSPTGYPTPGYELRIIPRDGFYGLGNSYDTAKRFELGGLNSWDVSKYLNVWCINFLDYNGLLGLTVAKSFTGVSSIPLNDEGVCILFNTLGKRAYATDNFPRSSNTGNYFDLGRTLTHEVGHVFEIWHVWGDDGGLCPWGGGGDDGIADTPPQGDHTFGNPVYSVPYGTIADGCRDSSGIEKQPIGIACLDYMDYTDDTGMHLFTPNQAAVMYSMVSINSNGDTGENYSLTQHAELLEYPKGAPQTLYVFPNPSKDKFTILYEMQSNELQQIVIYNSVGALIKQIPNMPQSGEIIVDLTGFPKSVYFVKCIFAQNVITQKILLE